MQRSATKLPVDAQQLSLLADGKRKAPSLPPDLDYLAKLPSVAAAITYAATLASMVPKTLAEDMGRDKTVWSRICSGELPFPAEEIGKFDLVVGNDALSLFVAHLSGWDIKAMRKAMNSLERENFELRRQLAEKDKIIEVAAQLMSGRVPR